jgi:hypothetical protein
MSGRSRDHVAVIAERGYHTSMRGGPRECTRHGGSRWANSGTSGTHSVRCVRVRPSAGHGGDRCGGDQRGQAGHDCGKTNAVPGVRGERAGAPASSKAVRAPVFCDDRMKLPAQTKARALTTSSATSARVRTVMTDILAPFLFSRAWTPAATSRFRVAEPAGRSPNRLGQGHGRAGHLQRTFTGTAWPSSPRR